MTAWDEVRDRIAAGDAEGTLARIAELSDQERRAVAKALPGYLREVRDAHEWRMVPQERIPSLRVAGAACIGGAAGVASWLRKTELQVWFRADTDPISQVVKVLADRPVEWRIDLARRLAARLRAGNLEWRDGPNWRLAARLLREAGAPPPTEDVFVQGWVQCGTQPSDLRDDPFLDTLAPRLFEADGIGRALRDETAGQRPQTWSGTLVALAADGRLKREMLLDGCVSRFLRGGTANDLKWFTVVHDALEPSLAEVTARARDYVRLLPTAPGPVAELALREVRRVDEARDLSLEAFSEAAEALLFRPEKKLVRAALGWLDRTARGHDRVDATLTALTVAFGQEASDLRERAVKVVIKHAPKASGEEPLDLVRDAAASLSADLRELIAEACGAVEAEPPAPVPLAVVPPVAPRELPPPISSLPELAEETAAALRTFDMSWAEAERLLAGLTRFAHRDPEGIRSALEPLVESSAPWVMNVNPDVGHDALRWLASAVRVAMHPPKRRRGLGATLSRARDAFRSSDDDRFPMPHRVMVRRIREIVGGIGTTPVLLASPAATTGHVDPGELVARLELLESAGVKPGTVDLEQALLRLPRMVDTDAVRRAEALSSPAGRIAAQWLANGGMPDPEVTCETLLLPQRTYAGYYYSGSPQAKPQDRGVRRVMPTVSGPDLPGLYGDLCRLPAEGKWKRADQSFYALSVLRWWPAIMPSHREVIAAHWLPYAADWTEESYGQGDTLLGMVEGDGPLGAATATALVYGLGARAQQERSASVDALLVLAGRGELPATELGTALGTLGSHKLVKLNRVTAALKDAAQSGAYQGVWTTLATALPDLLPEPGSPALTGLPDLLALATESAETTGARADIPALAAIAARGGTSRLAKETKRLHRQITSA